MPWLPIASPEFFSSTVTSHDAAITGAIPWGLRLRRHCLGDSRTNLPRLIVGHVWMDRESKNARCKVFGHRQRVTRVAVAVGGLLVQRLRVVDGSRYVSLFQGCLKPIAGRGFIDQYGVYRPRARAMWHASWNRDRRRQERIVYRRDSIARAEFVVKDIQLGQQNCSLQAIQAAIHASAQHIIAARTLAVTAQAAVECCTLVAVG